MDSVIVVNEAHVSKGRLDFTRKSETLANDVIDGFSDVFVRASKGKVVDLAKEKDFDATERGGVNRAIVRSAFEVKVRGEENRIDVAFPELSRFRVTL